VEGLVISRDDFLALPSEDVAGLVRQAGPQVCVFPINGTRRWAWLEHGQELAASPDPMARYMELAGREYVRLFGLLFEHGIDTILSPIFGSELLERGEKYVRPVLESGMCQFVEAPIFLDFYHSRGVRARFYGNLDRLAGTPCEGIRTIAEDLIRKTQDNDACRLLLGVFADEAVEQIARLTSAFYQKQHSVPGAADLVRLYYGEDVPPVTMFIGFDKPAVFDYPLLGTGQESLYFTHAPSPYLEAHALRLILYDHLYTRQVSEPGWESLGAAESSRLREYYRANKDAIQGVGRLAGDVWLPEEGA
jgi:adenosine tuberculosinyltransferase